MKKLIVIILCSLIGAVVLGQDQDYFVVRNDTTFCDNLLYRTDPQGTLNKISYTLSGKKVEIKGKKNVPDVITLYIKGEAIDRTPLKPKKTNGYVRFEPRRIDGKLIVYLDTPHNAGTKKYTPGSVSGDWSDAGAKGSYRFLIRYPDGKFYKVNDKKNLRDIIKPYLLECEAFKAK